MEDSAQKRPQFNVEEMPVQTVPESVMPQAPEILPTEPAEVIETVPQFTPPVPLTVAPPAPLVPEIRTDSLPPNVHSGKGHGVPKALLFLVPAALLVATIYFAAKFTGNNYVSREPAPAATVAPTLEPTPIPTATPAPVKTYRNEGMFLALTIPADYEVLSESDTLVSLGRGTTELLSVTSDLSDYDSADPTHTKVEDFLFISFAQSEAEKAEVQAIIESVAFLVDMSDWETFNNTTFNYMIKYPSDWDLANTEGKDGGFGKQTEISKNASDKKLHNLTILTDNKLTNAAFTASEIISSTRALAGWKGTPKNELKKIGGGDAQVIQGELNGEWKAYVVIWYKNTVVQMTWEDAVAKTEQETFDSMLASFEFTN